MKRKFVFVILVAIAALSLMHWSFFGAEESAKNDKHANGNQAETPAKKEPKVLYWVDSMHPWYKSDKPGIAPDCGMELTPVYAEDDETPASGAKPGTVRISARKQQLINIKLAEVREEQVTQNIRTVGVLQYDETKVAKIHSKIEGWIERLYVDATGSFVRKGQPLFSIYSPELVATQQEYLLAVKAEKTLGESRFADVSSGSQALRKSAYRRLKLWDVTDQQIRELEETGTAATSVTFYSPVSGFVLTKNVFEKQRIDYQTETYSIADLSTIWLMADIYEYEASNIHPGQDATMMVSYDSGKQYHGKVAYVYPDVNNMTRTLKARIEFPNRKFQLKPGMYANVELNTGRGSGLVIPVDAVLDSGNKKIVFVQKGEGEFEPREVEVGQRASGTVVVTSGLKVGEIVVASGNFLIDSESRLKSAFESMEETGHEHGQ